jgi:toxin HigB-1
MIGSFRNKLTESIFQRRINKALHPDVARQAFRRLAALRDANDLNDLRSPPGNRLEALRGDRQGQWSIRVNDQWRICFHWIDGKAENVEFCDYH